MGFSLLCVVAACGDGVRARVGVWSETLLSGLNSSAKGSIAPQDLRRNNERYIACCTYIHLLFLAGMYVCMLLCTMIERDLMPSTPADGSASSTVQYLSSFSYVLLLHTV